MHVVVADRQAPAVAKHRVHPSWCQNEGTNCGARGKTAQIAGSGGGGHAVAVATTLSNAVLRTGQSSVTPPTPAWRGWWSAWRWSPLAGQLATCPGDRPRWSGVASLPQHGAVSRRGGNNDVGSVVESWPLVTSVVDVEEAITAEPYVPNLKTLREKIDQDTKLLASLDESSDAYSRLQARITDQTTQLLDYEEILERRRVAVAAQEAGRTSGSGNEEVIGGLVFAVIGFVITYAAWGSWWLPLGIVLLILGIVGVIVGVTDS